MTGHNQHRDNFLYIYWTSQILSQICSILKDPIEIFEKNGKLFYRKPIPDTAWTKELSTLFEDLEVCITLSPVLARSNPSETIFFKRN